MIFLILEAATVGELVTPQLVCQSNDFATGTLPSTCKVLQRNSQDFMLAGPVYGQLL